MINWWFMRFFLFGLMLATAPALAAPMVYKSIGQGGEIVYSQTPPVGRGFEPVAVFYASAPTKSANTANSTAECKQLTENLAVLSAGGVIHEITPDGLKIKLDDAQVATHQAQIRALLAEQCRG